MTEKKLTEINDLKKQIEGLKHITDLIDTIKNRKNDRVDSYNHYQILIKIHSTSIEYTLQPKLPLICKNLDKEESKNVELLINNFFVDLEKLYIDAETKCRNKFTKL